MFVKIRGITRPAGAMAAVDAGADAIGLNFVPTSRRCVDVEVARAILAFVPDHVMTVGIFWDHPANQVLEITGDLGLQAAQLHGDVPPEFTAVVAAGVETVIKAVAEAVRRVRPWGVDVASGVEAEPAQKGPDAIARFVTEARAAAEQPAES